MLMFGYALFDLNDV